MDWKKYVREHLAPLRLGTERELEMADEMAQHLEAVYEDALADGATEQEAYRRAIAHIKDWRLLECELVRAKRPTVAVWLTRYIGQDSRTERLQTRKGAFMGSVIQDTRFGIRMLLKSKVFAAAAVLSLAVGIGANTAVFSLINALMLRMLPVSSPHELVLFSLIQPDRTSYTFSYPLYQRLVKNNHSFTGLIAANSVSSMRLTVSEGGVGTEIEPVQQGQVSGNYFSVLGAEPAIGRVLSEEDNSLSNPQPVAVISYDFWKKRFGLDPGVIGKKITLNEYPFTIVGVTRPGFFGFEVGRKPDLWWPLSAISLVSPENQALKQNTHWWLRVIGRLQPGANLAPARDELDAAVKQQVDEIIAEQPSRPERARYFKEMRLQLEEGGTGWTTLRQQFRQPLMILLAVVGVVLLTACANIANLLLARAAARKKEFAIRLAVGAGRWRIIRQLLTESIILAIAGGSLGLLFAKWGTGVLLTYLPAAQTAGLDFSPDSRLLGFTLAVSLLTGVVFGLAPAFQTTRFDLMTSLKNQTGVVGVRSRFTLNKTLVVTQVALSLVLLIGTGLFVRTFQNLKNVDVGFDPENLMQFGIQLPTGYTTERRVSLYKDILAKLEALPGARSATAMAFGLLEGSSVTNRIAVPGRVPLSAEDPVCYVLPVGPKFAETMGISLLAGRDFSAQDERSVESGTGGEEAGKKSGQVSSAAPQVPVSVLINQSMARLFFADENPIGKRFTQEGGTTTEASQFEVIGVVRDAKYSNLRDPAPKTFYVPYFQRRNNNQPNNAPGLQPYGMQPPLFELRTFGELSGIRVAIENALQQLDPKLRAVGLQTMSALIDGSVTQERFLAQIASFFSLFALLLASIGLYGIMSHTVSRRTNEIGIRLALGARREDVIRMVLGETMLMVVIGSVIGLASALAATRLVSRLLYGLTPSDPSTIALSVLAMIVVAGLAGYLPARKASRVDPMTALRCE
jgi:predicted permease